MTKIKVLSTLCIVSLLTVSCAKTGEELYIEKKLKEFEVADTYETSRTNKVTYTEAYYICKNLTLNGHTDWRLPTVGESKFFEAKNLKYPVRDVLHWTGSVRWGKIEIFQYSNKEFLSKKPMDKWEWRGVGSGNPKRGNDKKYAVRCVRGSKNAAKVLTPKEVGVSEEEEKKFWERWHRQTEAYRQRVSNSSVTATTAQPTQKHTGSSTNNYLCTFKCKGGLGASGSLYVSEESNHLAQIKSAKEADRWCKKKGSPEGVLSQWGTGSTDCTKQ